MVERAYLLSLVDEERERKLEFLPELAVAVRGLVVDAVDYGIALPREIPVVAQAAQLLASGGGVVGGVPDEDDVLPAERGEMDGGALIGGEGEIGGGGAGRERLGKNPREHLVSGWQIRGGGSKVVSGGERAHGGLARRAAHCSRFG